MHAWLTASRLNHLGDEGTVSDELEMQSLRQRYRECAGPAVARLNDLLASSTV
jgi:hypothetical protein